MQSISNRIENREALRRMDARIQRLANAITYYREMKPRDPSKWHNHLLATARRFNVAPRLIPDGARNGARRRLLMTMTIPELLATAADIQHQTSDGRNEAYCTEQTPCVFCQAQKAFAAKYKIEFDGVSTVTLLDLDQCDADESNDPIVSAHYPERGLVGRTEILALQPGQSLGFNAGAGGCGSITRI